MIDSNGFTKEISFIPAYDKRDPNPKKNYGIHGVGIFFNLSKDGQGISFEVFTGWMLPHVTEEHKKSGYSPEPMGSFVGAHHSTSQYEGQRCSHDCVITGGDCYGDGSGLLAEEFFQTLLTEGTDGVWRRMEETYNSWLLKRN